MANKRNLKRNINYVCSELFSEAVAASMYSSKATEEDVNALLASILVSQRLCAPRVASRARTLAETVL